LSYSQKAARAPFLALLAFDARLGQAVRQAGEPLVGQMRLAWWNEQLGLEAARRERSDELVVALDRLEDMRRPLHALVDGWELLLGERLDNAAIEDFADARAGAIGALAGLFGVENGAESVRHAARRWALADLAAGLTNPAERDAVLKIAARDPSHRVRLPRALRLLAVLDGLASKSLEKGGAPLLAGPASLLHAMRLGLLGR
jgi:phytoene synthase